MADNDAEILREGDEVARYVNSEGWKRVRARFEEKIMDLQSIKNLVGTKPEELMADIKARNTAIDILMEIIKELEGRAEQHKNNLPTPPSQSEAIIVQKP